MVRTELNTSDSTNITGPGKVTKSRHSTHNYNIADYIDQKSPFVSPDQYGAIGNGVSNDTISIQNAITASKLIILNGNKTYLITSALNLQPGTTIIGNGATIKSTSAINMIVPEDDCRIENVNFLGAGISSGVNQTGIFIDGGVSFTDKSRISISNCLFKGLGKNGARITRVVDPHYSVSVIGCIFDSCDVGLFTDERGEYVNVNGCKFSLCNTNLHVIGGNISVSGCTITDAVTQNVLISSGDNDAHGVISGCLINHGLYNVKVESINTKDFLFDGCDFYAGDIWLLGCEGVKFNGGSISATNILEEGSVNCYFQNVDFVSTPNIQPNYNSTESKVIYTDCIWLDSVGIDSSLRINGGILGISRTSSYTIPNGDDNYIPWQVDYNAISGNPSYTYEDFYLDTPGEPFKAFDFTKKVSPKRSWLGKCLINLSIGNNTTFNDTLVDVYLYDIDSGKRVGTFSKGIEKTSGADKYRVYTFSGNIPSTGRVHVRVDNGTGAGITLFTNSNVTPCYGTITGF